MQQVYGDRGAKIKGELPYLIPIVIFKFFCLFYKKGRKFCSSLHTFGFANNKKEEIITLNNFFNFIVLQNVIEFNKFFF
jgi:hypothetical protein